MVVNNQIMMFAMQAQSLPEIRDEQKATIVDRCEKAIEVAEPYEHSVYWCNFNQEGDLLEQMDTNAYQIKGSMNVDKKEELLLAFFQGEIKKLVTKPKMTAFGLNWQHCNHAVYFPTFSYEQYYQAIRRFWRFGQKRTVNVDLVFSDGQKKVMDSLMAKAESANQLFSMLNANLNSQYQSTVKTLDTNISLPKFL